jgi:hypothetical protein
MHATRSSPWTPAENELLDRVTSTPGGNKGAASVHARWTNAARAKISTNPAMKTQLYARTLHMVKERIKTMRKKKANNKRKQPDGE